MTTPRDDVPRTVPPHRGPGAPFEDGRTGRRGRTTPAWERRLVSTRFIVWGNRFLVAAAVVSIAGLAGLFVAISGDDGDTSAVSSSATVYGPPSPEHPDGVTVITTRP